jgi:hypothetical protein
MGAGNRVGIGLSYRPARLHRLEELIPWNRFLGYLKVLKFGLPSYRNYTEKENKNFLIYKEIQMGSGTKSYMRKCFLIYEEMHKYFHHI